MDKGINPSWSGKIKEIQTIDDTMNHEFCNFCGKYNHISNITVFREGEDGSGYRIFMCKNCKKKYLKESVELVI